MTSDNELTWARSDNLASNVESCRQSFSTWISTKDKHPGWTASVRSPRTTASSMRRRPDRSITIMATPPLTSCTSIRCARKCPRQRWPLRQHNRPTLFRFKKTSLRTTIAMTPITMVSDTATTIAVRTSCPAYSMSSVPKRWEKNNSVSTFNSRDSSWRLDHQPPRLLSTSTPRPSNPRLCQLSRPLIERVAGVDIESPHPHLKGQ